MITPIRGRKPVPEVDKILAPYALKDDNPDKGTETDYSDLLKISFFELKDDNPDKGTETITIGLSSYSLSIG